MDAITKINLQDSNTSPAPKTAVKGAGTPVSLTSPKPKMKMLVPIIVVAVIAGIASGVMYAKSKLLLAKGTGTEVLDTSNGIKVGMVVGAKDESIYSASKPAEGIIQPGGISGEGSHHLVRGDNASQWVYITSSVIDLDQFVGTKVTIWGETISGKKAGWLMDVGRLKVLQLNAAEVDAIQPSAAE